MSAPGEYGGISTTEETAQSAFSSTRARLQAHAAKLKKSILEGTVELATSARSVLFNGFCVGDGHSREHHEDKTGERLADGLLCRGRHRFTSTGVLGVAAVVFAGLRAASPPEIAPDAPLRVPHPDGRHGPRALLPVFREPAPRGRRQRAGHVRGRLPGLRGPGDALRVAQRRRQAARAHAARGRGRCGTPSRGTILIVAGKLTKSEFAGTARGHRRRPHAARARVRALSVRC